MFWYKYKVSRTKKTILRRRLRGLLKSEKHGARHGLLNNHHGYLEVRGLGKERDKKPKHTAWAGHSGAVQERRAPIGSLEGSTQPRRGSTNNFTQMRNCKTRVELLIHWGFNLFIRVFYLGLHVKDFYKVPNFCSMGWKLFLWRFSVYVIHK